MFSPDLPSFSTEQIRQTCLAMLSVARLHGLHAAEATLIADFWAQAPELGPFDPAAGGTFNAAAFGTPEAAVLVLDLCLACAFADGSYSAEERGQIAALAAQLGLPEAMLLQRTDSIRLAFLGSLAHLPDSAAVAALGKSLAQC